MARARFSRSKQARRCAETQVAKVAKDVGEAQIEMALDVLKEGPLGLDLVENARDLRPEMSGITCPSALTGDAEGLAGIAGREQMNAVAPWAAIEGSKVTPDSSLSQGLVFHPGHESGRCMGLPLDVTHSPVVGFGEMDPKVEAAIAGAQGEPAKVGGLRNEFGM